MLKLNTNKRNKMIVKKKHKFKAFKNDEVKDEDDDEDEEDDGFE